MEIGHEMVDAASGQAEGEWAGWRRFVVARRVAESAVITSFHLRPVDGRPVIRQRAGQYLTLRVTVPGGDEATRTYTVSCAADGEAYRISVKREPQGAVSRWLHEAAEVGCELDVAAPVGSFALPDAPARPVVLLSGGVGATPMISMLDTVAARFPDLETHYVHATTDATTHAFGDHVRAIAAGRPNIRATTFYSRPRDGDLPGPNVQRAGRVDIDWLRAETPVAAADYYVCGPSAFIRDLVTGLAASGVPRERVHYEYFGAADDLSAATPRGASGDTAPVAPSAAIIPAAREKVAAAILGSAADAVIVSDRDGTITMWNPGAERIFGFTEAEAVGRSLDIIVPEALRGRHWDGYAHTVASGRSRYGAGDLLSVPGLHKDGHRISIEFTIAMMHDATGAVDGMAAVLRDVTRRFEEMRDLRKQLAQRSGAA